METNPLFAPAYALEHLGYNQPLDNPLLNEIVPRVVALATPFFYALQVATYFTFTLLDIPLYLLGASPGYLCRSGFHTSISLQNLASSTLEIPEKLLFGSHHRPNYLADPNRYVRKDLTELVGLM